MKEGNMTARKNSVTLLAVGDILLNRDNPESLLAEVAPALKQGDVVFAQVECSYSERGQRADNRGWGGFRAHPRNVPAIAHAGIKVVSIAGNHTMDYGPDAFSDTLDHFRQNEIKTIGGGRNIKEARTPALFEIDGTRVAFLGYNSIIKSDWIAREDHPGMAPLRVKTFYEQLDWQPGTPAKVWTLPVLDDLLAVEKDIAGARRIADIVVVSVHWGVHHKSEAAMYQINAGHRMIDAGADLILGHHTHRLNPIAKYKGKFIFFGLGNFAFQSGKDPNDPYLQITKQLYDTSPLGESAHKTNESRNSIMVKCEIADQQLQRVSFRPATANDKAEPRLVPPTDSYGREIIGYLENSSREFGVKLLVEGDEVVLQ
jgi:poly-gamma-glutamate capsule biosynthesis protein CapA/YwtB (metallophosphatase superfamily)